MGRKKKEIIEEVSEVSNVAEVVIEQEPMKTPVLPISVDYPTEGLNNMAKKINELVELFNGL